MGPRSSLHGTRVRGSRRAENTEGARTGPLNSTLHKTGSPPPSDHVEAKLERVIIKNKRLRRHNNTNLIQIGQFNHIKLQDNISG